jgi:hypothetical protein
MNPAVLNNPFVHVALPVMFTILIATWINNKGFDKGFDGVNRRIDDLNRRIDDLRSDMITRFDEVNRRLDRIEDTLKTHTT